MGRRGEGAPLYGLHPGMCTTFMRHDEVDGVAVQRSSGFYALDNAALRAIARAQQLPALPAQFTNPSLTLRVTFEYR